ncbi:glycosyltransferase [Dysgonomonas sp.]
MKILLAHKYFQYNGGADVFFFETGRVLEENGHKVAYFSTSAENNLPTKYAQYFIKAPQFKNVGVLNKIKSFVKIPYNFDAKRKFEKLVNDFKPDVIHVFNIITQISPSILDVARKKGIPIVISCNDYKHICPNYKLFHHGKICEDCKGGRFYKTITNKCCHDSLLISTASAVESYVHSLLNVYRKNIQLFLFASDFMAYKTMEFWGDNSFKWSKLLNPFKIPDLIKTETVGEYGLYFGRLIDEKGVDVLIEALKYCSDIPFKIVGDGPDLEKLQKEVEINNLDKVEFTGAIWGVELNEIIAKSRFVVIPSIWHENFPYVVLQAFAQAKPVIGTNRGGLPELISENRGLIYKADNPQELADKIKILYNDGALCQRLGQNSRSFIIDNFNDNNFYTQLINNYKKVIK